MYPHISKSIRYVNIAKRIKRNNMLAKYFILKTENK